MKWLSLLSAVAFFAVDQIAFGLLCCAWALVVNEVL